MPMPAAPHAAASTSTTTDKPRAAPPGAAAGAGAGGKRRVVLIADPTRESSAALQWALSHAVLEHDEIVLLHVEQPRRGGGGGGGGGSFSAYFRRPTPVAVGPGSSFVSILNSAAAAAAAAAASEGGGEGEFLEAMRAACEKVQPKVRVQVERVEMDGKDKAAVIMAQTKTFGADLLVIGQRRISTILGCKLSGSISGKPDIAEYLIDNSKCLCVGVQKKGQNAGYLLNTKTHKNFWLLA